MSDKTYQSKQFYDTIIKISHALTGSLTRQELLKSIQQEVKPLFNYHSAGLFVVYEKEDYHIDLTAEDPEIKPADINYIHQQKSNVKIKHKGSYVHYSMQQAAESNGVVMLDFVDLSKRFPDCPQFQVIEKDDNPDYLVVGLLQFQDNTLGMFCLNAMEKNFFPGEKPELFRLICDQLAIAVSNLLANEEIKRREQEKAHLLALGGPIARVRNRKELLQIVYDHIREIFPFDDTGLFTLDDTGEHHIDWIVEDEITNESTEILQAGVTGYLPHKDSVVEGMMQEGPALFRFEEINKKHPGHPQYSLMKQQGIKQFISRTLFRENEKIGMLCFNSKQEDFYSEKDFRLFDSIANQINVAVLNILANEEILRREWEKTQLLKITERVSKLRNLPEFLAYVISELKSIFDFYDVGIFIITEDGKHHFDLATLYPEISPSINNHLLHQKLSGQLIEHPKSLLGNMIHTIEKAGGVKLFDFDDLKKDFPDYPQFEVISKSLRDCLAANLTIGDRTLGMFSINKDQKGFFRESLFPFFKSVTEQLSVAISNILANEKLMVEKQFTEQLLSISESISGIQDRRQLLEAFFTKVKSIIPYDEYGLFVLDESEEHHYELVDASMMGEAKAQKEIDKKIGIHAKYKHQGSAVAQMMKNEPTIYDVDELGHHPQMKIVKEAGLQHIMGGPLLSGDKAFGMLCFNSFSDIRYTQRDLDLFKPIAEQMATAVSKILAYEEIQQREQEKGNLLKISEAIASVKSREDLLKAMLDRIKPMVDYEDAVITIYESDQTHYRHFISSSPQGRKKDAQYYEIMGKSHTLKGTPDEYVLKELRKTGILFWETKAMKLKYPKHFIPDFLKKHHLEHNLYLRLVWNSELIGFLHFHFIDKKKADLSKSSFYQSIADQLSATVANIIANEQLIEEKQFKETLLSISEAVATINDRKQLLKVIYERIQPVFPFDNAGLFIIDEEKDLMYEILDGHISPNELQHTLTAQRLLGPWRLSESNPKSWWMQDGLVIDSIARQMKYAKGHVGQDQFKEGAKHGLSEMIGGPLLANGKKIGAISFNTTQEGVFDKRDERLFKNISEQIGVAVANILANEQILEEKSFKETLLDISEAVAAIQERRELLETVFKLVKPVFPFDSTGLFVFDDTGKYHIDLTVTDESVDDLDEDNKELAQYGLAKVLRHPSVDVFMEKGPMIYLMDKLKKDYPDHPYYPYMKQKVMIGGPLINAGKPIGTLFFLSTEKNAYSHRDLPLFKAIADQLAVAVSNVLAHEQLLEEKRISETLLSIVEGISSIRSKKELLSYIVEKLKPIFGFYDTGIVILDKQKKHYTDWSAFYRIDDSPTNLRIFEHYEDQTNWNPYVGSGVELAITESDKTSQPIIFDWNKDWSHLSDAKIMSFLKGHAYDRSMVCPFKNGSELLGAFWINFLKNEDIDKVSKPLFQGISDQLAVAISNILANEEIERRERLKSLQVETVTIFNQDKDWDERFEEFIKALQPHVPFHFASIDLWDDETDYNRCKNIELIGSNEYRLWGPDDFERASGVPKEDASKAYSISRNWHFEERKKPVSQSKAHKTILKILNKIMDIEQHIDLGIHLQDDRRFLLSLYKKGNAPYTPEQTALLQELSGTLGQTIEKALITERVNELNHKLVEEKAYLQEEVKETYGFEEIVGESAVMQKVFDKVSEVSAINATVLILGETGTGKELIARAIHNNSPRRDRVLVKVNCAAIPSQIVESELFGHEKGAFTGAIKQRIGKFELANNGTIFLDEIGDMPMELQAKLLRVLQEREVERVGSNTMIKLDFRVIAATNKNLVELVAEGKFRADLFYRLNTFPLYLPALREREKDAELLAKHFARQLSQSLGLPFKGFSKKSLHNISNYEWPGNVRELQNVIEQAMILQKGKKLDISPHRAEKLGGARTASAGLREIPDEFDMDYINAQKENLEKEYLMHMLEKTKWRVRGKGGAAELLDVHPNSLDYYLKKLGISKK